MSTALRAHLEAIAGDMSPPLLPDDVWRRGRRVRRRARLVAAGRALLVSAVLVSGMAMFNAQWTSPPGDAPAVIPERIYLPRWSLHAHVANAPPGLAALRYERSVGEPHGVVVGRSGAYRFDPDGPKGRSTGYLSPDGRYLANRGVIIDLLDGRRITYEGWPEVWSPDGTLLTRNDPSDNTLNLINPASGARRQLEYPGAGYRGAAFSPDGSAVIVKTDLPAALVALNLADGGAIWQVPITGNPSFTWEISLAGPAAWTRDGRIAVLEYLCPRSCVGDARLWFLDARTGAVLPGGPTDLPGLRFPYLIAVRPGEGLVMVASDRGGGSNYHPAVYLIRPDGSQQTLLDTPSEVTDIDIPRHLAETGQFGGPATRPARWPVHWPALLLNSFFLALVANLLIDWLSPVWRRFRRRLSRRHAEAGGADEPRPGSRWLGRQMD